MSVKITISLFSGVKNPSFVLSDAASEKYLQQFSIGRFKKPNKEISIPENFLPLINATDDLPK